MAGRKERILEITESWLDLKVNRYEDGNYEAYEALSDSRYETDNWSSMHQWLRRLIEDTSSEVYMKREQEEVNNAT